MKRKKKAALPRLTVLALSRRELVSFCDAIESLRHLVAELREVVPQLAGLVAVRRPGRRRAAEAEASAEVMAIAAAEDPPSS